MPDVLAFLCYLVAFVCFVLYAITFARDRFPRAPLIAIGLAAWVLVPLAAAWPA